MFYNFGHELYEEVAVLETIRMRMKDELCQEDHQALRDSAAGSLHVLLLRQGQQSARGCNVLRSCSLKLSGSNDTGPCLIFVRFIYIL